MILFSSHLNTLLFAEKGNLESGSLVESPPRRITSGGGGGGGGGGGP